METDDPHGIAAELVRAAAGDAGRPLRIAVSDRLTAYHLLRLQAHLPDAEWSSATGVLRRLRMVKDADEIELLRLAAEAADRVVDQIASGRLVGRTEADVADEVRDRLRAEGHELAEFAIVASGPNSASPHHEASERVIRAGEPIVLDIGGALGGYGSDTTRTLWVTGGDEANGPGRGVPPPVRRPPARRRRPRPASSGPGWPPRRSTGRPATSSTARATARRSSTGPATASGSRGTRSRTWSPATTSRSRPGWRSASSRGSTSTGRYGARIEDIVICGPDGPITLNRQPRELRVVAG